jgi:MFS family permease
LAGLSWARSCLADQDTSKQWSFFVFFGIFEIGSVLCGAAVSSAMLIVGRAVAGFGAAGIINGAITIISSCAPLEKRPGERLDFIRLNFG